MRISVKVFPGVRISGGTRSRRRSSRGGSQYFWHDDCKVRHRTQEAAQKHSNSAAFQAKRQAAATQARAKAAMVGKRTVELAAAKALKASEKQAAKEARRSEQKSSPDDRQKTAPLDSLGSLPLHALPPPPVLPPPPPMATSHTSPPLSLGGPADHEAGWACLYLAWELERGIASHEEEYRLHESHQVVPSAEYVEDPVADLKVRLASLQSHIQDFHRFLDPEITYKAIGKGGVGGDEEVVRYVASGITNVYVSLMQWARTTRSVNVPELWRPAYEAQSEFADVPIRQVRRFSADWSVGAGDFVRAMRAGLPHSSLNLTLKLDIGDDSRARFSAALEKVKAGS